MATLQVKGMDDALYKALGARAAQDRRSISQEVVMMIRQFLARPADHCEDATRAFLGLAGTWKDERSAEVIARDLRQSRRTGRRFRGDSDVPA